MIDIPLLSLKVGDIIVDRAAGGGCHSLVVVQTGDDPRVVHVHDQIVEEALSVAQGEGGELFAFRMRHNQHVDVNAVRTLVGRFAQAWAGPPTWYGSFPANNQVAGANRFQGTKAARQSGVIPPLGYDALFRILKWATRAEQGLAFSEHRGTTCCAFLLATYQAACVTEYIHTMSGRQGGILPGMFMDLRDNRGQRPAPQEEGVQLTDGRSGWQHTFYPNQALIQNSNRGSSKAPITNTIAQHGIDAVWRSVAGKALGYSLKQHRVITGLADLLTPALNCDVKFSAATLLIDRLPGNGWKAL